MGAKKPWSLTIAGLAAGAALSYVGYEEYAQSRRLAGHHESVQGKVTEVQRVKSRRSRDYIVVEYVTTQGESFSKQFDEVPYLSASASVGTPVTIFYHPPDPMNAAVMFAPTPRRSTLQLGLGILAFGAIMGIRQAWLSKNHRATQPSPAVSPEYLPRHDYAPADPKKFSQLDLAFYDSAQRLLERRGFTFVCDEENLTATRAGFTVFVRIMRHSDGTAMANIYHMRPPFYLRLLGGKAAKVAEVESEFSDGTFVCIHNSEAAARIALPPQITSIGLKDGATVDEILAAHAQAVANHLAIVPGRQILVMRSHADITASQDRMQKIKSDYRKQTG